MSIPSIDCHCTVAKKPDFVSYLGEMDDFGTIGNTDEMFFNSARTGQFSCIKNRNIFKFCP